MNDSIESSTESVSSDYNVGHPTTKPIAEDIEFLPSTIASEAVGSSQSSKLEPNDVEFFKIHGYLIKRGLLSDQTDAFQRAIDQFWLNVPNHGLRQNDPGSWLDNPQSHWRQEDHMRVGSLLGTNWKMRSRGENGIGTESFLVDQLANHPKMLRLASEFLGATIKRVQRVRGIYGVFPIANRSHDRMYPHGDYMASQLSAMVLICDVPPRCGGFTVWPGSHRRMHLSWDRVSGSTISGERIEMYPRERDRLLRETAPVEFTGSAGDVIWWHPRLIHSAGVNYSAETDTPMVRILTPIDYQRAGATYVDDLEYGPGPKYQWWVDTRNVVEDVPSTPENLWRVWGFS